MSRVHFHLYFRDAFEEAKHPRAKSGEHAGEFVGKGVETGFAAAEKSNGKFTLPGGGKLPAHITKLRIPPAWTNVRFNPDPRGGLLVAGTDGKGYRQPIYSERHHKAQAAQKFARIKQLEPKFPRIKEKNAKMMRSRDPRTRDLAVVLGLIMHTGMRPGSETDTGAEKQAYGATTLEGRHVQTEDGNTVLRFVGKSGKDLTIPVSDPDLAAELKRRSKNGADQKLFPEATEQRLLRHVQNVAGKKFMTKDFRTLIGTKTAAKEVESMPVPKTPREYKKAVLAVAQKVSEVLGNTRAVALKSYIAPHVFAQWRLAAGA